MSTSNNTFNAQITSLYLQSGLFDPSVDGYESAAGSLYIKLVPPVGLYQKLDEGFSTNWTLLASALGGGVWGSISGLLANQTDLQNALNLKQNLSDKSLDLNSPDNITYPTTLAVSDALALKLDINVTEDYEPNNEGGSNYVNRQFNFLPLQNSPNNAYNLSSVQVFADLNSSGFDIGTNGRFVTVNNIGVNASGLGSIGEINHFNTYLNLGNGIDPISVRGFSLFYGFGNINDGATINGNIQGYGFQFSATNGSILTSQCNVQAFYDACNIQTPVNGYTSYSTSPNILAVNNNNGMSSFSASPQVNTFLGNSNYNGLSINPQIQLFEDGGFNGIIVNPNIGSSNYSYGLYVDMRNVTVNPGIASSLVIQDLTLTFNNAGDNNNFTISYVNTVLSGNEVATITGPTSAEVAIESGVSTALQIKTAIEANFQLNSALTVTVSGIGSNTQVSQASTNFSGGVNSGTKWAGYFEGNVHIQGNISWTGAVSLGQINAYATLPLIDGGGNPQSAQSLISAPTIAANTTVNNADFLGCNTAMLFSVGDNSVTNTAFLGVTALGLPAVVSMGAGSLVDRVGGAVFAVSLDNTSTGGTIDTLSLCRAVGLPNGITTINKLKAYEFDFPFGPMGTKQWGLYFSTDAMNWVQGSLKVGGVSGVSDEPTNASVGLELDSTVKAFLPSRMTTAQKLALTPINGMVVYDLTLNKLQGYEAGSWQNLI